MDRSPNVAHVASSQARALEVAATWLSWHKEGQVNLTSKEGGEGMDQFLGEWLDQFLDGRPLYLGEVIAVVIVVLCLMYLFFLGRVLLKPDIGPKKKGALGVLMFAGAYIALVLLHSTGSVPVPVVMGLVLLFCYFLARLQAPTALIGYVMLVLSVGVAGIGGCRIMANYGRFSEVSMLVHRRGIEPLIFIGVLIGITGAYLAFRRKAPPR